MDFKIGNPSNEKQITNWICEEDVTYSDSRRTLSTVVSLWTRSTLNVFK